MIVRLELKFYELGDGDESKLVTLHDPDKKEFSPGSEEWFLIATDGYLGNLVELEIKINTRGIYPAW